MNKRRSIINLIGKTGLLSLFFTNPSISKAISCVNIQFTPEYYVDLDLFVSNGLPFHFKLRPGEIINVRIVRRINNSYFDIKKIFFKMPLISLRPHYLFHGNNRNGNTPLLVLSVKGCPLKEI